MSISIYLMIGLTWGLFYIVLYQVHPHAFSLGSLGTPNSGAPTEQQVIPVLLYFSLTTLSTIGFGDILPVTLQARYAAAAEGITGQVLSGDPRCAIGRDLHEPVSKSGH